MVGLCMLVNIVCVYTGHNRLGNKKYANFCISFEIANPTDVRVNYMDNGIGVREWIEENGIGHLVRDEVTASLRKIDRDGGSSLLNIFNAN